jgi:hypothetical protein
MNKRILLSIGITAALLSSCKKDETTPLPVEVIPYTSLTPTSNYFQTFLGPDSNSSVDFSGQTTRVAMMKELDAYAKTGTTTTVSAAKLKDMFTNQNSPFTNATLNQATDKTISAKTAQSFSATDGDAERQRFNSYFDSLAAVSVHHGHIASQGNAGLLDGKYLVSAKGFEYGQFIQKGLIGAMMLDQISNIYLGTDKQSADNNDIVAGKNYTALEHHWDEAYGYLTQNETYPKQDPNDATKWLESYLGSYVRQAGAFYGDASAIYMAFLKGRAAIVNKDDNTRGGQISAIRSSLEKAIALVAVSYLNKAKTGTTDGARFHALSEGVGFIYALRFAHNPRIDKTESDALLNSLMNKTNGFWSLSPADLDDVRNQVADAFSIDRNAIVNH